MRLYLATKPTLPPVTLTATAQGQTAIALVAVYPGIPFVGAYNFEWATSAAGPFTAFSAQATFAYTDSGLAPSTTRYYRCRITLRDGGVTAYSNIVSATTAPQTNTVTGAMTWIPGIIARTGASNYSGFAGQLATVLSYMDKVIAADINKQVVGFCVPGTWANFEGPTQGVYDGSWGGSQSSNVGFAGVQQLITKVKSYNPPRFLMLSLNQCGNGSGANTNTAYPSNFAPTYLSTLSGADGGCEWGGKSGYTDYQGLNTTFYRDATAQAAAKMINAYYDHFGPDTTTGGINMWELTNEMSFNPPCKLTGALLASSITNGYAQIRAHCPEIVLSMRPTFVNPSTPANYQAIGDAMRAAKICMGNEDGANITPPTANSAKYYCDWGTQLYIGRSPVGAGLPDHSTLNDWAFVWNVENAEFGIDGVNQTAVPYASKGTGYIYDDSTGTWPGWMNGVNRAKASYLIIFLDGQQGPNVNRFQFTLSPTGSTPAPNNPTPGPGAGSNALHPNLMDVITGNTAYSGITAPLTVNTTRPVGW